MEEKQFYTIRETAKKLHISEPLLRRWYKLDVLPGFRVGRRQYIDPDELVRQIRDEPGKFNVSADV